MPRENPVTPEKVALGRKLYFDKRLSKDGTVSCATCHDPTKGFSDGKKVSEGIGGQKGARNAPTVLNAIFFEFQFWDGRAGEPRGAGQGADDQPGRDGDGEPRRRGEGRARGSRVRRGLQGGLRPRAHDRRRGGGDRHLRAHRRHRQLALRPLHGRRQGRDVRVGAARLGALERQGALQHLPPVRRRHAELLRQQVPQHRRRGQGPRLRRARAPGRAGDATRRSSPSTRTSASSAATSPRSSPRTSAPSRPRACATSRSRRPTCTTAARRRSWTS